MKWLNRLFGWSWKQEKLLFTSGKGNINVITQLVGEHFSTAESAALLTKPRGHSVLKSEFMEFDYPMTIDQYNAILKNPYGIIMLDGFPYYLNELKYKWKNSLAQFKVVPKSV